MIRRTMKISVLDNSTITLLKCLNVHRKHIGIVGDIILGVVNRELYWRRTFRKRFFHALIMMTGRMVFRAAGAYYVKFPRSGVLLLNDEKTSLFGTRFYSLIPVEIRKSAFRDICQYSRRIY